MGEGEKWKDRKWDSYLLYQRKRKNSIRGGFSKKEGSLEIFSIGFDLRTGLMTIKLYRHTQKGYNLCDFGGVKGSLKVSAHITKIYLPERIDKGHEYQYRVRFELKIDRRGKKCWKRVSDSEQNSKVTTSFGKYQRESTQANE